MGLRVSTNVAAINAQRNLSQSQKTIGSNFSKLASGSRINKASDDAAGLAISEKFKAQIRSTRQANRNANDAISMVQTAEGGLNEIGNIIVRLRELAIQSSSDSVGETERGFINEEVQQLKAEVDRIAQVTKWGEEKLLDGSTGTFDFQVGIFNSAENDRISFKANENVATASALNIDALDYSNQEDSQAALEALDGAQTEVSRIRAGLGALQNRLTSTTSNLAVSEENLSAANSRIRDTDVAQASADLTKNNILLQASTATLAQANQATGVALSLIG